MTDSMAEDIDLNDILNDIENYKYDKHQVSLIFIETAINAYTTNKIIEEVNHHIDKAQSNLRRKYQLNRSQRHGMDILSEEIREQLAELKALQKDSSASSN